MKWERFKLGRINALGIQFDIRLVLTDELKSSVAHVPMLQEALVEAMQERAEVKAAKQRIKAADLTLRSTTDERLPFWLPRRLWSDRQSHAQHCGHLQHGADVVGSHFRRRATRGTDQRVA